MNATQPDTAPLGLEPEAQRVDQLAREVLRDDYLQLRVVKVDMSEDYDEGKVALQAQLSRSGPGVEVEIVGAGVGLVDAFFEGMIRAFSGEYPSLKTLSVSDFSVGSGFDGSRGRRSDALATATLRIRNSEGVEFSFTKATPSVTRSSVQATLDALTFFLNAERAYVQLHIALRDAKQRRRSDLVERFQSQMSTLVSATSYSEVIENLRRESEG